MKKNVGTIDRVIRLVVSVILAYLYFSDIVTGTLGIVVLIIAGVFTLTSLVGTCAIYALVGMSTASKKENP